MVSYVSPVHTLLVLVLLLVVIFAVGLLDVRQCNGSGWRTRRLWIVADQGHQRADTGH